MGPRVPRFSFGERKERLRAIKISILGDLHGALAPAHDSYRRAEGLAERRVVGRRDPVGLGVAVRALDHVARKTLRRLGAPEPFAIDGTRDHSPLVDLF